MIRVARLAILGILLLAMTRRSTALNDSGGISFNDMFLTFEHSNQGRALSYLGWFI